MIFMSTYNQSMMMMSIRVAMEKDIIDCSFDDDDEEVDGNVVDDVILGFH